MKVPNVEIERRLARLRSAVKQAGAKLTYQRIEIFREVASSREHPDAETVFRAVRARVPTISLDTVYRTLWTMHDLGILATLGPRRGSVRFDANLRRHHHFVCGRCGLAQDFESAEFDALPIPANVLKFGRVDSAQVEVRGVCRRCARGAVEEKVSHPKHDHLAKRKAEWKRRRS